MRNWRSGTADCSSRPRRTTPGMPPSTRGGPARSGPRRAESRAGSGNPHEEAALDLIRFLTGEEQQQLLFYCGGYAPTRQDIYEQAVPGTGRAVVRPTRSQGERLAQPGQPALDTIRLAIDDAQLRPVTPYYSQFSEEVSPVCTRCSRTRSTAARSRSMPSGWRRCAAADRALDGS